ncbi:MAG TPA: choice-of-anchor J domain-containing protein [Bacteroidales bacterium]|nr:choice-of-anchor J domain-containing protein [Bacteroidales bacterium]HOX78511.1 choice-of-anchor J domain-containing protein [Bacteroidales bacterium]HPI86717.1 choice-of-anchor J domain-containing protein [Bacteroidales bacterium]HPM93069.1 choice-of-anchor J domain-containing protein [Bacteroidales bacterium]
MKRSVLVFLFFSLLGLYGYNQVFDERKNPKEMTPEEQQYLLERDRPAKEFPVSPEGGTRAVGDDCTNPIIISIPAALPYNVTGQTNCGRGNTYSTSCLGNYDGGEDIMYRLDVTATTLVTITMNPGTTTYTGMYLSATCGNSGTCIATSTGSGATPRVISNQTLTAGNSYYVMVDTWPTPNCIPSFSLNIVAVVANPVSFSASAFSSSQINLTFTPNASNHNVVIVWNNTGTFTTPAGTPPAAGQSFAGGTLLYNGTTSPQSHTGLNGGTIYYYKAFSYDGSGYSSGLTANATTPCAAYSIPYTQDFNGSYLPTCWYEANGNAPNPTLSSSSWTNSTYFANTTGNSAAVKMNLYGTDNDWLISPPIDLGSGSRRITLKVAGTTYNGTGSVTMSADDTVFVLYSTNLTAPYNFVKANAITYYTNTHSPSVAGWDEVYELNGLSGNVLFAFYAKGINNTPDMDFHIDDFVVEEVPACPKPTGLFTDNIGFTQADLDWVQSGSPAGWEIIWGLPGFDPETEGTLITGVSSHPYTLNPPLDHSTIYQWYVKSDCGDGMLSGWSGPASFQTLCQDITVYPYSQSFDGIAFPPICWDTSLIVTGTGSGTSGNWDRVTSGTFPTCSPFSGVGMTKFASFNFKSGTKSIMVSPSLELPKDYYSVSFWMFRDNGYPTNNDMINIYYNNSPDLNGAELLGSVSRYYLSSPVEATANLWYNYEFTLPEGSAGSGRYIIVEGVSAYGNNIFFDEFIIREPSSLSGYVLDFDGNPVEGVLVEKVGGINTYSAADGSYELYPLPSGNQQFKCSMTGNNDLFEYVDIPLYTTVNHNFTMLAPEINLSPGSFLFILGESETGSENLILTNTGNGTLDWVLEELDGAPVDVPWLVADDYAGQLNPFGDSQTLLVTVDASLTPGSKAPGTTYQAGLKFSSPSGIEPDTVPITLIVTDGGVKGPENLQVYVVSSNDGKFMLKWLYFTIKGLNFEHFLILQNGQVIGTSEGSSFNVELDTPGMYCYKVFAVYSNGVYSNASNVACINYPLPPNVPVSNWALLLAAGLMIIITIVYFRRRF